MEVTVNGQDYFVWWKHRFPPNEPKKRIHKLSAKPSRIEDTHKRVEVKGSNGTTKILWYPDRGGTTCFIRRAHGDLVGHGSSEVNYQDTFNKKKGRIESLKKAIENAGFPPTAIPAFINALNSKNQQ